jgi:hypothetical protein
MWIDNVKNAPKCNPYKEQIFKDRCEWKNELTDDLIFFNTTTCAKYCTNIPNDGCQKLFYNYCKNDNNKKYCLEFCNKPENKEGCLQSIRKLCSNREIITDKFCQNTVSLVDKNMTTIYENVMEDYCNNKEILDADKQEIKNDFCACYDKELINKNFSDVKKDYLKDYLFSNPQCNINCRKCTVPSQCPKNFKAFKKTLKSETCDVPLCKNSADKYELVNVLYHSLININMDDPRCKTSEIFEFVVPDSESDSDSDSESESASASAPEKTTLNNILIILLVVFIIIIVIVIIFMRLKKQKRNIQYYNMQ